MAIGQKTRSIALAVAALGTLGIAWAQAKIEVDASLKGNALVVRYRNVAAASVELLVNGQSALVRSVGSVDGAGEATLSLDGVRLADGENRVEIRIFGADGQLLGTETTILTIDRNPGSVARLSTPRAGATVQGPVQLTLDLKRELRGVYVSFFVNGNLAAMKNFPPYSYLWDTTREPNGWHDLEAWVVDDLNSTYKSNAVRVFVNNPGGRTERRIPAGTPAKVAMPPVKGGPAGLASVKAAAAAGSAAAKNVAAAMPAKVAPPAPVLVSALGAIKAPIERGGTLKVGRLPEAVPTGARTLAPTGQRLAAVSAVKAGSTAGSPLRAASVSGDSALRTTSPATPALRAIATANRTSVTLAVGTRVRYSGRLSLSLDGKPVLFDVEPRVENGVPLTPFRHLFEAAGGEVAWSGTDRSVTAERPGSSVWLKIGDRNARIDRLPVKLELAPYLDRGRTVVPLSFVRDALKVDIEIDEATGHVVITQAKR